MNALISSAAILGGVSKRGLQGKADLPAWRVRIAEATRRHGRLKEIADAAGMTSPQLQKISNGSNQNPGIETLGRIAAAIGLTLSELTAELRSEEGSDRGGRIERNSVLEDHWGPLLEALDAETPAADSWQGDVLKAVAALNRALRRSSTSGEAPQVSQKAGR